MLKKNNIVVFDFETWSRFPEKCQVVQVACCAIDYVRLQVIEGSEFSTLIRPLDMNDYEDQAIKINGLTPERVSAAPPLEVAWSRFAEHVRQFNPRGKSPFSAPLAAGKNIRSFDLIISDRLCRKFKDVDKGGKPNLFHSRYSFDIEEDLYRWFGHTDELPSFAMDDIRPYFGLSSDGAHDALVDVRQTAQLLLRFLQLYRSMSKKVRFRESLREAA